MKKKIIIALLLSFMLCTLLSVVASAETKDSRLVDGADLLSSSEETEILARLDEISKKYEYDVVIVTQEDIGDSTEEEFADDYYDNNGYGFGDKYTGLLLLIAFDEEGGMWHITTCGDAINAFTDSNIESIGSEMEFSLSSKDYAAAFNTFIDECDYYINGYVNGFPFETGRNLVISIVIGFIFAYIVTSSMKGKLKSVKLQKNATSYVKSGSLNVTTSRDFFLYSEVKAVEKKSDDDKSSTHTSSSGREHGGGGGRF